MMPFPDGGTKRVLTDDDSELEQSGKNKARLHLVEFPYNPSAVDEQLNHISNPDSDRYDGESDGGESDDEDVGSKALELLLGEDYGPLQERIRKCQITNPVAFLT